MTVAELDPKAAARETQARETLRRTMALAESGRELVVGPWHGEVGYETLYWIPFVRRLVESHAVDRSQVTAVSRGGVASWYEPFADGYVELLDAVGVEEFRRRTEEGWQRAGGQKQDAVRPWDVQLLRRTLGRRRASRAALLHPSAMVGLLGRSWKGGVPLADVLARLSYARWTAPRDPGLEATLPDDLVAARFYFSRPFPDNPTNRAVVRDLVAALAERSHVVLLHTGLPVDDHEEVEPELAERVHRPLVGAPAADNLRLQSVVLGRARAFVGTYGGFSYLAAAYGVPTIALASDPGAFFPAHLDLARRLALAADAPFTFLDTALLETGRELADTAAGAGAVA